MLANAETLAELPVNIQATTIGMALAESTPNWPPMGLNTTPSTVEPHST